MKITLISTNHNDRTVSIEYNNHFSLAYDYSRLPEMRNYINSLYSCMGEVCEDHTELFKALIPFELIEHVQTTF